MTVYGCDVCVFPQAACCLKVKSDESSIRDMRPMEIRFETDEEHSEFMDWVHSEKSESASFKQMRKDLDEMRKIRKKQSQNTPESNLLTTGQMLDALDYDIVADRVFEKAGECSDAYTRAKLDECGDLMFYIEHEDDWWYEKLTNNVIKSKWIIKEEVNE